MEDGNGIDKYGFNVLSAGCRYDYDRSFNYAGKNAYFWSATENEDYEDYAYYLALANDEEAAGLHIDDKENYAHSVRCIRD